MIHGNRAIEQRYGQSAFEAASMAVGRIGRWLTGRGPLALDGGCAVVPAFDAFDYRHGPSSVRERREAGERSVALPDAAEAAGRRHSPVPLRREDDEASRWEPHRQETDAAAPVRGDARPSALGPYRLDVTDARVRAVSTRARSTVGYANFVNEGRDALTVVALESSAFERIEMYEPPLRGAAATRRTDALTIAAHDSVAFRPGGRRLLLIGPRRPLRAGQLIGVTVTFASGRERLVTFRVAETVSP